MLWLRFQKVTAFVKLRFGTRTIGRFSGDKIPLIQSLTMKIHSERKMPKKIEPLENSA